MSEVELLTRMMGRRLLVIGDLMLDEYLLCTPRRLPAEAPVVEVRERTYRPGGAANVAMTILGLGGEVDIGGVIGADCHGEILVQLLEEAGAGCSGVLPDARRPTTTKMRIMAQHQTVVRVDTEKNVALTDGQEAHFFEWFAGVIREVDGCVLSDYAKGVVTPALAQRLIGMARRHGKFVVVDPKGCDYSKYRGATLVKPNQHEAEQVLGRSIHGEADLLEVGRRMQEMLAADAGEVGRIGNPSYQPTAALLITRASLGMALLRPGCEVLHIPATVGKVSDVTGAGDTVIGTLALALAAGASLEQSVRLANRAAGIVVGKVGTASLTRAELQDASRDSERKPKRQQKRTDLAALAQV
jgi:D-glycero-beta-D-manno-heptose-7-phosphate kinase